MAPIIAIELKQTKTQKQFYSYYPIQFLATFCTCRQRCSKFFLVLRKLCRVRFLLIFIARVDAALAYTGLSSVTSQLDKLVTVLGIASQAVMLNRQPTNPRLTRVSNGPAQ